MANTQQRKLIWQGYKGQKLSVPRHRLIQVLCFFNWHHKAGKQISGNTSLEMKTIK